MTAPRHLQLPPLVVIGGPTATGKTGLSLELADALLADGVPVEIISADSRQVYRGLDIGTAKVGAPERARIRHHGLDLVDPDQPFSVADFADHAAPALGGMGERGAVALLVGGTGFYLRAVADGLDLDALPYDPAVRRRIEEQLASDGLAAVADQLRAIAPVLASGIDLRNPRRVARALEIAELRGDGPLPRPLGYGGPILRLTLVLDPATHRAWIAERARAQFEAGLIEEAAALRRRFDPGLPAFSAIGYREAWAVLDGELTLEAGIALDAQRNVAFARRQRTWFRSQPADLVLDAAADPLAAALPRVRELLAGSAAERPAPGPGRTWRRPANEGLS